MTDAPSAIEVVKQRLIVRCKQVEEACPDSLLEAARQSWLERYGPEQLAGSSDLLTLFHGTAPKEGLLYEVEFGQQVPGHGPASHALFGTLAGASAVRSKVYRSQFGSWMKAGPGGQATPCTEDEALAITKELVRAILHALEQAEYLHLGAGVRDMWREFNTAASTLAQLGWVHKYLAIVRPDLFSFHHSGPHLRAHLIRLGLLPNEGRWLLDWQWRNFRLSDPELAPLHPYRLSQAAFDLFGVDNVYWIYEAPHDAPTATLSLPWPGVGNVEEQLQSLPTKDALLRLRRLVDQFEPAAAKAAEATQALSRFALEMRTGHRVVVTHNQQPLAVGVVSSDYAYAAESPTPHQRVLAPFVADVSLPPTTSGVRPHQLQTVSSGDLLCRVERLLAASTPAPPAEPPLPLKEQEQRIKSILDRKGQVILYGPPGTGKTYHARRTAYELVARELFGRSWPSLTEAEREKVDARAAFCTFAPYCLTKFDKPGKVYRHRRKSWACLPVVRRSQRRGKSRSESLATKRVGEA